MTPFTLALTLPSLRHVFPRFHLYQVALVAAAPDHTLVLLQASCPSLPHADSLALEDQVSDKHTGSVSWNSSGTLVVDDSSEDGEEGDSDVESVDVGDERSCLAEGEDAAARTWFSSGLSEPLSLKQQCEVVLARQVDMRNVCSMLAFADTLDAPSLVKYCAEYVGNNLDGILVLGRPSDRECLLEASGPLVSARRALAWRSGREGHDERDVWIPIEGQTKRQTWDEPSTDMSWFTALFATATYYGAPCLTEEKMKLRRPDDELVTNLILVHLRVGVRRHICKPGLSPVLHIESHDVCLQIEQMMNPVEKVWSDSVVVVKCERPPA